MISRLRYASRLHALGALTFLSFLLLERFYLEFMICRRVPSHRSGTVNCFGSSSFRSFKPSSCTFSQSSFTRSRRSFYVCLLESTIDMYSSLRKILTQRKLSHLSPLECLVSRLHDLSPCGEILEVDMWPNQVCDTCHILTDFSILQMLKTY
jgi:hypothetical protein